MSIVYVDTDSMVLEELADPAGDTQRIRHIVDAAEAAFLLGGSAAEAEVIARARDDGWPDSLLRLARDEILRRRAVDVLTGSALDALAFDLGSRREEHHGPGGITVLECDMTLRARLEKIMRPSRGGGS